MKVSYKTVFVFYIFALLMAAVSCGEDEKHEHEPERIHTIHHHHVQKYQVIKKVEVPVIKEVKVPYYVYVPIKAPYTYTVRPMIVKVPIEYFHTKSEEHGEVKVVPAHEDEHEESHMQHDEHAEEHSEHGH